MCPINDLDCLRIFIRKEQIQADTQPTVRKPTQIYLPFSNMKVDVEMDLAWLDSDPFNTLSLKVC